MIILWMGELWDIKPTLFFDWCAKLCRDLVRHTTKT